MESMTILVQGKKLQITNPEKLLWEEQGISKLDYIQYLLEVAGYLLPYTRERLLTMIRYPDGSKGKSFFQKEIPEYAPEWVPRREAGGKEWILLNDLPTLVWVANQAALELHVPFNLAAREDFPSELIIDLDPMDEENFGLVREVALRTKEVLDSFGLMSVAKTSGATGIQIYVPLVPVYTYEETRMVNRFIARYLAAKYPEKITLERSVQKRGKRLYFDYLQLWRGRTLPAPYSVRARAAASVSTPLTWEEIEAGVHQLDFTIGTVRRRVKQTKDLFGCITDARYQQKLDTVLSYIKKQGSYNNLTKGVR